MLYRIKSQQQIFQLKIELPIRVANFNNTLQATIIAIIIEYIKTTSMAATYFKIQ